MSKKLVLVFVLTALFALATAGAAFAGSEITYDATGASKWTYQDAYDLAPKTEGSYRSFEASATWDPAVGVYTTNPHGGYATTSNNCQVCHAVHRATGSFALLRVDNPDNACDFCHIGAGRHSELEAYFNGTGGIYSTNGHTIGSGPDIPDSSVWQWVETQEVFNQDGGSIEISVRRYLEDRNQLMRYVVHGGRTIRVGPQSLRCMSCHQVHNAQRQIWQPASSGLAGLPAEGTKLTQGYKLLRNAPSGGIQVEAGAIGSDGKLVSDLSGFPRAQSRVNPGYYDPADDPNTGNTLDIRLKAIEDTVLSVETVGAGSPNTTGYTTWKYFETSNTEAQRVVDMPVYETSLSFWCADCHNLNIAGKQNVGSEWGSGRTGENMLGDRSHAVPSMLRVGTVAEAGSQCYMCHNNDMPLDGTNLFTGADCGSCHVTPQMYHYYKNDMPVKTQTWAQRDDAYMKGAPVAARSDFPHSGPDQGKKLLNARDRRGNTTAGNLNERADNWISTHPGQAALDADKATFGGTADGDRGYDIWGEAFLPSTGDGTDKVCKTCHGPMKKRSIGYDK